MSTVRVKTKAMNKEAVTSVMSRVRLETTTYLSKTVDVPEMSTVVVEPIGVNITADMVDCTKPLKKRKHKCVYCGKLFLNAGHLKSHVFIHTGERPYKCDLCNKSYIDKCRYIVHKRSHSGEKPFPCHFCEKAYVAAHRRRHHERIHMGERIRPKCEICQKRFL